MNHAPSDSEVEELVLRVAVAIASRRDAFRPGEKLAQGYLDDARVAVEVMRGFAQQPDSETSELRQLAVALRANTVKLRFFRGATYDGGADTYLTQLTQFIDAVMPMLGPVQRSDSETAQALAHELFAHECFAFTGDGPKPHSRRCQEAAQRLEEWRGSAQRPLGHASEVREALELAEDVLSRSPFSTNIWPNGMHPNTGITKIRAAIKALSRPSTD
jgi:hypothetical protein